MHAPPRSWHHTLVQLGRFRTLLLITGFSVALSLALTIVAYLVFDGQPSDRAAYFIPAALIPAIVAPLATWAVVRIAFDLDAAHTALARQEARSRALLTAAPVGIAHLARDGRVLSANAQFVALAGSGAPTDSAPVATGDWRSRFADPADRAALDRSLAEGAARHDLRWPWQLPDGTARVVRAHLVPAGGPEDAVLVLEDVTAREADAAVARRADKLDLASRLANGVAHDLNNLLTIVRASAAALRPVGDASAIGAIDEATARGARLTRRLLAISGRDVHDPVLQPIASLLDDTADLMRRVLPPGIALKADRATTARLRVDRDAVEQALFNLIVNARDALGDAGTIRLAIEMRRDGGRAWTLLTVTDDGPGMSAEVLARASEPFFTTKPAHLGTGLGLAIGRDTRARHAGRIVLTSAPGAGTRAELWFPTPSEELDVATDAPSARRSTPTRTHLPVIDGRHLLLIEDEPLVRYATERILVSLGAQVRSVTSVEDALPWLAGGEPYVAIVSDVTLPGASGLDLLRTLRAQGVRTPVLLVSGYSAETIERAIGADADAAFLGKPWDVETLEAKLVALISGARR